MPNPLPGRPVRGSQSGRPLMALLDLLGRRWSMRVLWELSQDAASFRQLQERCGHVSSSVLNRRLAELRAADIVRQGDAGYELTPQGAQLMRLVAPLRQWADRWGSTLDATSEDTH